LLESKQSQFQRRRNQFKLLGIFAVAGVPVMAAMLMYFGGFAIPSGKTNKGELLLPSLPLSEFGYTQSAEGLYPETNGKWLILQTGGGACNEECQNLAYIARQVNILMAREQERVDRILLNATQQPIDSEDLERLKQSFPELDVRSVEVQNSVASDGWSLWVSDPLGNVILKYDASNTGYDLRDDLKKLLKLSNIG